IANTMLMSIFERTKEIGIFKVLGCSLPNIRGMFLTEAGLIGLCGGALGVTLSYALSYVINKLVGMGEISLIPFWLAAFGLGFAVLVGMASGFYPARRAMKLSPLEAIRTL
ncbi:MAG: FtsX-like permease family protein, partial [Oscillospiraceae bacterium]